MYCLNILAGNFMILDLFCALSIVLIFVLFYFHLRAFSLPRCSHSAKSLIFGLD